MIRSNHKDSQSLWLFLVKQISHQMTRTFNNLTADESEIQWDCNDVNDDSGKQQYEIAVYEENDLRSLKLIMGIENNHDST